MDRRALASARAVPALGRLVGGLVLALSLVAGCDRPAGVSPDASPDASPEGPAGSASFRGGPERTGVFDTTAGAHLAGLAWRFETGGTVRSSPVVAGDALFVGSSDGNLYALDAGDGRELWRYEAGSPIASTPAVVGDFVVFGTRDNRVLAVERQDGALRWEVSTGKDAPWAWGWEGWDYFTSSPVVSGSTVLIGSGDGGLYALALADGSLLWRHGTGGKVRSSPAVADGRVVFGSADGRVRALDLASGEPIWEHATEGAGLSSAEFGFDRKTIVSSPAVAGGAVYVGARDGRLYALDAATGDRLWSFPNGPSWVIASPAVADGAVYSGRSDVFLVRAIDAGTGEELWAYDTGGYVYSSPAVVGDAVYVGSGSGRMFAFDRSTGEVRWSYRVGAAVFSSPFVRDAVVYFGSDDGSVYALRTTDGPATRRAVFWDDALRQRSLLGAAERHREIASSFEDWGYEPLDGAGLETFLEDRIADRAPSVVVFAMDALPAGVVAGSEETPPLLRRYLDAGGKVVWLGLSPLLLERNADGQVTGLDRAAPERLLDVDHQLVTMDAYGAIPTEAGRRWGLERPWVGREAVGAEGVGTVLATNELGRAAAWVEQYGGPEGTGFVRLSGLTDPSRMDEVRRVAEHGLAAHPTEKGNEP